MSAVAVSSVSPMFRKVIFQIPARVPLAEDGSKEGVAGVTSVTGSFPHPLHMRWA
eukprot:CAMPEP_0176167676 /NCGR_PEP_ID=MMETSP0120_2-20121206/85796_1 /TAXON_ID=160619 /ORGANISM="Kryptoperidinium foliaceum, Strain CCMP 1326" /LENGTH=54 /DNA_ID=CAMNT_0017505325 /DNA_START=17 /DNA_END=177 /DNA_ORIENTATION=+